jgi:hypothetical protein
MLYILYMLYICYTYYTYVIHIPCSFNLHTGFISNYRTELVFMLTHVLATYCSHHQRTTTLYIYIYTHTHTHTLHLHYITYSYALQHTHAVNIMYQNLGPPLSQKREISHTARCFETNVTVLYFMF